MKKSLFVIVMLLMAGTMAAIGHTPFERITGVVIADDGSPLPGVNVILKGTTIGTVTDLEGKYELDVPDASKGVLEISFVGYMTQEIKLESKSHIKVTLQQDVMELSEVVVTGYAVEEKRDISGSVSVVSGRKRLKQAAPSYDAEVYIPPTNEEYAEIAEWGYKGVADKPLSTFSIDVDAASYANMRRYLNNGQRPPADAVRIEEMINYFNYDYREPAGEHPFSINTEVSSAPWNPEHKLVHIGLQGKNIPTENLPPSNLVFLLDVSGSMSDANKLPLLKSAFRMLVGELRPQDKVSIVVYAGAAGVVLEPTSGSEKDEIIDALSRLQAGGSTAGGAGILKAYDLAEREFVKEGNNRVILATDGDFNVGLSSNDELEKLIEQKRESGIFLTVLGFGTGNLKDSKMETLADKGNGNYAYIDNIQEARKVFVNEFGGTLFTIAKDVKIQVEFNPANVQAYRLIGYENRALKDEDFNNDKKDAGELGAGHTVTALYEVVPVGVKSPFYSIDPLKYQKPEKKQDSFSNELMTVKLRYKKPDGNKSQLITEVIRDESVNLQRTSDNFRWSAAVAGFGMWLRESEYLNEYSLDDIIVLAKNSRGDDAEGYRSELVRLMKTQKNL
ncbi:vWA domain-containing protein [Fulvivirga sedimenti]|uniref:von Willebrand factor type A domain-containing protein n=1 Tax=Fulvivirga sedimenti TaxID=2879465 RepID=A0A9X1KXJ2_9BACT|nr:VWA domain-containing protein [Fulvivirga sedimenti]MCA6074237.1 von Willebrand factor type A domain-containing protein [Fulvivirga sedimenti]